MNQPPHRSVVTQRQQLLPAGVPRVPGTEGGGRLVWEHDEVLALVKDGLSLELLFASGARPGVGDQTAAGGEFPQLYQGVLKQRLTCLHCTSDQSYQPCRRRGRTSRSWRKPRSRLELCREPGGRWRHTCWRLRPRS